MASRLDGIFDFRVLLQEADSERRIGEADVVLSLVLAPEYTALISVSDRLRASSAKLYVGRLKIRLNLRNHLTSTPCNLQTLRVICIENLIDYKEASYKSSSCIIILILCRSKLKN